MRFERPLKIAIRVLAMGAVLALIAAVFPLWPRDTARAAGLLSLSPDEGRPGDSVQIDGTGLTPGQTVKIYFSSNPANIGDQIDRTVTSYEFLGQTYIGSTGAFDNPVGFTVPGVLVNGAVHATVGNGDYYIYLTYAGSASIETVGGFFVLGPMSVSPTRGRIGDYTNINATGLTTGTSVYVYFSSQEAAIGGTIGSNITIYQNVGLAPVDQNGTLGGGVSFQIPSRLTSGKLAEDVHGGDYYFYTAYYLSRTVIATVARFTVVDGQISLQPSGGAVGTEIKISGQGLRPSQHIGVEYEGNPVDIKSGDTVTDGTGAFSCNITVPDSAAGSHGITVSDMTGDSPEAWFTVNPGISLSAGSASLGQMLQINGHGFGEAQQIAIKVNGETVNTNPPVITTNQQGTFNGAFEVMPPVGQAQVAVTDSLGNNAQAGLNILPPPVAAAAITLTPATSAANPGYVGMELTVDGTGFKTGAPVTVEYSDRNATVGNTTANAEGQFEVSFKIPPCPAGDYHVTASDGSNTASATFVMEGTAPPPPVPVVPELASGVPRTTHFEWSDVQDPSGITYTFQVASDSSFTTDLIEKTGLTTPQYTLAENEQLQLKGTKAPYYWRVRAVDGAGNQSDWTVPTMFYVGSAQSPTPPWTIYVLVVLGVVLGVSVGVWLHQRGEASRR